MALEDRRVGAVDREVSQQLHAGYAQYYDNPLTPAPAHVLCAWPIDAAHPVEGLLVLADDQAIGLVHDRDVPSSLRGIELDFLDELFVAPDRRGSGVAQALLDEIGSIDAARGWPI